MKVTKEKMVLHLPFDEEAGSTRAYNYAPNRTESNDALLSGDCEFTEDAVFGNALRMGVTGEVSVGQNLIDYSGEFSITAYIKPTSPQISFLMNFSGANLQHSHSEQISPNKWYFCAIQRVLMVDTYYCRFVLDQNIVYNEPTSGTPTGCALSTDEDAECIIDDVRVYNRALSLTEVFTLQKEDEHLSFYVDGVNFNTFGVEVSKADGLLDALERKDPLRMDWDSMHGEAIDLSRPHWQARDISLECYIVASNNTAFIRSLNRFIKAFSKAGTQRLTLEYAGTVKPLEYDVYRNDKVELDYEWIEDLKVGTFTLTLREPQPIKMVLKHICPTAGSSVWFQCNIDRPLTVTWGDQNSACTIITGSGNASKSNNLHDANGNPLKVQHTFAAAGEYDIVIHGNIERVTNFTTNTIVIYGADNN